MTNLLNRTQIILMATLLFLSITMVFVTFYYVFPTSTEYEKNIETTKNKIRSKQADIRRLRSEREELAVSISDFNILKQKGFFNAQDRVTAREMLDDIIRQSDVVGVQVSLSPALLVNSSRATEAKHKLLSGPMAFKVSAYSDKSVYQLMTALMRAYPGFLELKSMSLSRVATADSTALQMLQNGLSGASPLVNGEISFIWWSLASEKQMEANPYFNPARAGGEGNK